MEESSADVEATILSSHFGRLLSDFSNGPDSITRLFQEATRAIPSDGPKATQIDIAIDGLYSAYTAFVSKCGTDDVKRSGLPPPAEYQAVFTAIIRVNRYVALPKLCGAIEELLRKSDRALEYSIARAFRSI